MNIEDLRKMKAETDRDKMNSNLTEITSANLLDMRAVMFVRSHPKNSTYHRHEYERMVGNAIYNAAMRIYRSSNGELLLGITEVECLVDRDLHGTHLPSWLDWTEAERLGFV